MQLKKGKESKCYECMPELLLSNVAAWNIFLLVNSQVIVGGLAGIIDINHLAVWKIIEKYGFDNVDEEFEIFEKVILAFRAINKKSGDKQNEAW